MIARPPGSLRHPVGACAAGVAALALFAGCGGRTGEMAGTVTYQAKHLRQGTVSVAAADGSIHTAVIQDDGTYAVAGVPTGDAKVYVTSSDPRTVKVAQRKKDDHPAPLDLSRWVAIPAKYADIRSSGLVTDIKPGRNPFDIELK